MVTLLPWISSWKIEDQGCEDDLHPRNASSMIRALTSSRKSLSPFSRGQGVGYWGIGQLERIF
jgi:hypothetical protein